MNVLSDFSAGLKKLLYLDAITALGAGLLSLMFVSKIADFTQIPNQIIVYLGIGSLLFGIFAMHLGKQFVFLKKPTVILIIGNFLWADLCFFLALGPFLTVNKFGMIYLIGQSIFVTFLSVFQLLCWVQLKNIKG